MGLKLTVQPGEKIIVGNAVIKNLGGRMEFEIENEIPVLRHRDILSPNQVHTPCQHVYYTIQLLYLDGGLLKVDKTLLKVFWDTCREIVNHAPTLTTYIDEINELIIQDKYYQALKSAKKLLQMEEELLRNV